MDDVNNDGYSAWGLLREHFSTFGEEYEEGRDPVALIGLLRVMVLHCAPPPTLVALLSPKPACVMQEGAWLRARLPAYITHRRAYLDLNCSRISLLPGVLQALVHGFEGSAATDELWATGLGTAS
jgi:hypothetical protein